jgi:Domain of unknown function (DUF4349)
MPATETSDFEREFEELVRDLRALPTAAPRDLRERVRALGEPPQPRPAALGLSHLPRRRSLLVLAPACVLALVAAAVVHGVLSPSPSREAAAPRATTTVPAAGAGAFERANPKQDRQTLAPTIPSPNPNRRQDYEAWLTVRVRDLEALSERTNDAMRIARSLGGYVVSLEQSTAPGQPGEADLVLRVPVAHAEEAVASLGGLGTVLDRHLSIRDLERAVQEQQRRILRLKLLIVRIQEALQKSLPTDVRLRLQLQLDQARADLSRATNANKATLREASLSRVSLTLTTQKPVGPAKSGGAGRVERAARDAASFLGAAGAVVLFLLIVLSPVIALAAAVFWAVRAFRRREERRLLSAA